MTSPADRIVGKLARGPVLSRLLGQGRQPLKLVAVPRDHVVGDRRRGDALVAGRFPLGTDSIALADIDFAGLGTAGPLARGLQGFSWLRDLAAVTSRDRGAQLAEAIAGRWLLAHGPRVDAAWAAELWGERILFWTAYAPYILSSRDPAYRSALLNTLARGARHALDHADRAAPGLDRITAWCGALTAALTLQGAGGQLARCEAGLLKALAAGQHEDGGLLARAPDQQALLVDRLGLVRAAYFAARQTLPDGLESAAAAALAALHGVTMGDGRLSSWQGGHPGDAAALARLVDGCGLRARPLRNPRGWGYHRLTALGTVAVIDAAAPPPARFTPRPTASTLAFELSDGAQRLVVNCGGPGPDPTDFPPDLIQGLRTTAACSTLVLDDTNSTALLDDGGLGRGVGDVRVERSEDDEGSLLVAAHDGYLKGFGLLHERRLRLANDGKELVGEDRLVPRGRRRIAEAAPYAIRFHLAPGVEPVLTADGLGALLRSPGAPPWNFRVRGASLQLEESLHVDGDGRPQPGVQLVAVGEVSAIGGDIHWSLRRSS